MTSAVKGLLLAFAFFLPLSIAAAEPCAILAFALWTPSVWTKKFPTPPRHPLSWPIVIFLCVAVLSSVMGMRPAESVAKLSRFFLLGVVWVIPAMSADREDLLRLAKAFVIGALCKALYDVFRIPAAVMGGTPLFQTGNMREPQMYSVGLLFVLAGVLLGYRTLRDRGVQLSLLLLGGGLVLHFKRGMWISFVLSAVLLALLARRRKAILWLLVCVCAMLALPQVRDRLAMTSAEFSLLHKGRMVLWTEVAPVMIKEFPFGMGWKATRHEDFQRVTRRVERKLNHLHDNPLQVTLELGWMGLAAWLWWMLRTGQTAILNYSQAAARGPGAGTVALGCFAAFVGLMLNGLVEYNFGDAEIFMVMALLMGIIGAQALQSGSARG